MTEPSGGSLTRLTVRGFAWAFTGTVSQALLQIVSMVVLARLLTPAEFGSATAAVLVVGFCQLASQLGVGPALVHRKDLDQAEIRAAFWFSVLFSATLAAVLWVGSGVFNQLVGLPADSWLIRVLTLALVLNGVSAVPMGLLQRGLRLRELALVDVLAFGGGTIGVSVLLAALGVGAASVVWGAVAGGVVTSVGYLLLARPGLRPLSPVQGWRYLAPLLRFGAGYSLSQFGNWAALNADNLVVSRVLGPAQLGVYARAYNLLSQPANIIGAAADKALFPAMAKVRDDGERLRTAYVRAASLVALVTVPASVLLFVLAPEIVNVLLGSQWTAVVAPLQAFAIVLLPRTSYRISGSLTRATGAVYGGAWRQWLYGVEVVVGSAVGSHWGVTGVAVGASVAIVLHYLVTLQFSGRVAPGLVPQVLRMYLKHVPVTVVSFASAQAVALATRPHLPSIVVIVVTAVAWLLGTGLAIGLLRSAFRPELGVLRAARGGGSAPSGTAARTEDDGGSGDGGGPGPGPGPEGDGGPVVFREPVAAAGARPNARPIVMIAITAVAWSLVTVLVIGLLRSAFRSGPAPGPRPAQRAGGRRQRPRGNRTRGRWNVSVLTGG